MRLFSASTCASQCKLRRLRTNSRLSALLASQFIRLIHDFSRARQPLHYTSFSANILGLCLGGKGQLIGCVTRGREGGEGGEGKGMEGGMEGGEGEEG